MSKMNVPSMGTEGGRGAKEQRAVPCVMWGSKNVTERATEQTGGRQKERIGRRKGDDQKSENFLTWLLTTFRFFHALPNQVQATRAPPTTSLQNILPKSHAPLRIQQRTIKINI